jgi:hypothetical protein
MTSSPSREKLSVMIPDGNPNDLTARGTVKHQSQPSTGQLQNYSEEFRKAAITS